MFERNRHRDEEVVLDVDRVIIRADKVIIRADNIIIKDNDDRRHDKFDDVAGLLRIWMIEEKIDPSKPFLQFLICS